MGYNYLMTGHTHEGKIVAAKGWNSDNYLDEIGMAVFAEKTMPTVDRIICTCQKVGDATPLYVVIVEGCDCGEKTRSN